MEFLDHSLLLEIRTILALGFYWYVDLGGESWIFIGTFGRDGRKLWISASLDFSKLKFPYTTISLWDEAVIKSEHGQSKVRQSKVYNSK